MSLSIYYKIFHTKTKKCETRAASPITISRSITMLCGTDNIPHNIPPHSDRMWEYFMDYCQSHITLLWM